MPIRKRSPLPATSTLRRKPLPIMRKTTPQTPKIVVPKVEYVRQGVAVKTFSSLCAKVTESFRYSVTEKNGTSIMVITGSKSGISHVQEVNINQFRENFSQYSHLVRVGFCFKIVSATLKHNVYVRPPRRPSTDPITMDTTQIISALMGEALREIFTDIAKNVKAIKEGQEEAARLAKLYQGTICKALLRQTMQLPPFPDSIEDGS